MIAPIDTPSNTPIACAPSTTCLAMSRRPAGHVKVPGADRIAPGDVIGLRCFATY
jgi:hypothetical protein